MTQALEKICVEYGAAQCLAVMRNSIQRDPIAIHTLVYPAAIEALMKRGMLKELRELMREIRVAPMSRLAMYVVMSKSATPDQHADILLSMRTITSSIVDPYDHFDADFSVFLVSRVEEEWDSLEDRYEERFNFLREVRVGDVHTALLFASFDRGVDRMAITLQVLEHPMLPYVRESGESLLWSLLSKWDRTRLNSLASQLPNSRYLAEIRRLAAGAREANDPSLEDQDSG